MIRCEHFTTLLSFSYYYNFSICTDDVSTFITLLNNSVFILLAQEQTVLQLFEFHIVVF